MNCSVEISMYPLDKKYKKHIIEFIKKLRLYKSIKVISNGMSTQIFGKFTDITPALNHEIQLAFKKRERVLPPPSIRRLRSPKALIDVTISCGCRNPSSPVFSI